MGVAVEAAERGEQLLTLVGFPGFPVVGGWFYGLGFLDQVGGEVLGFASLQVEIGHGIPRIMFGGVSEVAGEGCGLPFGGDVVQLETWGCGLVWWICGQCMAGEAAECLVEGFAVLRVALG